MIKKILLTGATDGIGLETAKRLANQGHHLLIHGRSERKLADAIDTLKASCPKAKIESYRADLSRFSEIRAMLQSMAHAHESLDVIINNAGVFKTPEPITQDGLDIRFVVNTFAPYIITRTLLPLLADHGRVVNLSSAAQAPINLDAMQGHQALDQAFQAYAQSKLALTIWSQELAQSLALRQVMIAVNPGSMLASKMVQEGFGVAGNDLSVGAECLIRTALSQEFADASGKYFDNDSGQLASPHPKALDRDKCSSLMEALNSIVERFYGDLVM
ncbi:MAG: oxidoreductase [Oleiphilus sp.]|nr:MAG: oxidoreductase [Oleiphilus sp.]